jgi:glycosyltransferase involved in cell wall biosynthesis
MDSPLVSVCVITYNHVQYIRQALESVLMQKVDFKWEIIIADDFSTDGTREIVEDYGKKFPELIRLISRKKNVGPGLNFVELINSAKGKYVAYLEGDDYWIDENKLTKQLKVLEANIDFSACYHPIKWDFTYEDESFKGLKYSNENDPWKSTVEDILKKGWFIRSCSMFFRSFQLPHGFEQLYIGDYPLHFILATKGDIAFLDEVMGAYRIHNSGSSEQNLVSNDFFKRKKNFYNEMKMYDFLDSYSLGLFSNSFNIKKLEILKNYASFIFFQRKNKIVIEFLNLIIWIKISMLIKLIGGVLDKKQQKWFPKKSK